jgi:uncharacterized protein YndB with AHSA1/START domain
MISTAHATSSTTVTQSISIAAAPADVWHALTDSRAGENWRGADFKTDWRVDSPIDIDAFVGALRHRAKGAVIRAEPPSLLQYNYWSRMSGLPDEPQFHSTITMTLDASSEGTTLTVEQHVPPSPTRRGEGWEIGPESGWKHVEFYWRTRLPLLKRIVEQGH